MTEPSRRARGRRAGAGLVALVLTTLLAPHLAVHQPDAITDPAASRNRPPGTTLSGIELADGTTLLADRVTVSEDGRLTVRRIGLDQRFDGQALAADPLSRWRYPLGSDHLGRDLLARLLYGWRNSFLIAIAAASIALLAGTIVGLVAAHVGGRIDRWVMRFVDILRALPKLFLLLAVAAAREPGPVLLVLLLAAVSWMSIARLARAEALALRKAEFSDAARSGGCSATRVLLHHHLPHLRPTLITLGLLQISSLILLEAALSFLGAGLSPTTPSLGGLVADAALRGSTTWWMILFPGLAIAFAGLVFRWIGHQLDDSAVFSTR